jgi:hypothetical protein
MQTQAGYAEFTCPTYMGVEVQDDVHQGIFANLAPSGKKYAERMAKHLESDAALSNHESDDNEETKMQIKQIKEGGVAFTTPRTSFEERQIVVDSLKDGEDKKQDDDKLVTDKKAAENAMT